MSFRYNPFEEMDRLFEQTRRAMMSEDTPAIGGEWSDVLSASDANLGMEPTDDGYVVTADLPGFETSDIDLRFEDGVLAIRASVDVTEGAEGHWQRRSRRVHEHLAVPGTVREDEITASYRNGVLEVQLPTEEAPEDDGHRIDIE